mgnify:FL=1
MPKKKEEQKLNLLEAINDLAKEEGLDVEDLIVSVEEGMAAAFRREFSSRNIRSVAAEINRENGEIFVYKLMEVVEEVEDPENEITVQAARELYDDDEIDAGDEIEVGIEVDQLGRLAAIAAKSAISQKVRDAKSATIMKTFTEKRGQLVTGIVDRRDNRGVTVIVDKVEAIMGKDQQVKNETYVQGKRMKFLVLGIEETTSKPIVRLSRTNARFIEKLFEDAVPEINSGDVEIKAISREPGSRTKIAVYSRDPHVDAKGSCVGPRGQRVQQVLDEIKNEKIDIIMWSDDDKEFISEALQPATVVDVQTDSYENEDGTIEKHATVIVPDEKYSLAIGRAGQNVRLAARLTGYKIDIRTESDYSKDNKSALIDDFEVVETEE